VAVDVAEPTEVEECDLTGAVTVVVYVGDVVADPRMILIRRLSWSLSSNEAAYNAISI
jgi:hypothetical protein